MKSKFAIFDIDHTLISKDSMFLFLSFGIKKHPILIFYLPIILIKTLLYFLKIIDVKKVKESYFIPLKILTNRDLEEFYDSVLTKNIYPEMMELLKEHKNEGRHVLLVSASPEVYLKFFKKNGYIDGVIGTVFKNKNGKYINKILGENCKGFEKVRRINGYLQENNLKIDFEDSFAYSDSLSDKPMLSLVRNKYKVNKNDGSIGEFVW